MLNLCEPHIMTLSPYVAGRPVSIHDAKITWAKLASNENCLGPSPKVTKALINSVGETHLYPLALRAELIKNICEHHAAKKLAPKQVALGSGSSELIVNLVRGLVARHEAILFGWPTFVMYQVAAHAHDRQYISVDTKPDYSLDLDLMIKHARDRSKFIKLIFLANPNNPTGNYISKHDLENFINHIPKDIILVLDEAYFEYATEEDFPDGLVYALSRPRTVVLRTFSKAYSMAGLRLGYAMGDENIIDILCRMRDPFNINLMAQVAGLAALSDQDHVLKSIEHNNTQRQILHDGLLEMGFGVLKSAANFICAKPAPHMPDVASLCAKLLDHGVIIRGLANFGMPNHLRITVGTEGQISQLFSALHKVIGTL